MKLYAPLLLLLLGCSKKEEAPAPAPVAPTVPVLYSNVSYDAAYLESVQPVITMDLSSTAGLDWSNTLSGTNPYYQGTEAPKLASRALKDTLTVTVRVPRMPASTTRSLSIGAEVQFAGHTMQVRLTPTQLRSPATYGPTGAIATVRIPR